MKESSVIQSEAFEGLKWSHVLALAAVLRDGEYTEMDHIKKRYAARASHFDDTLAFMLSIGALRVQDGSILVSHQLSAEDKSGASAWLAEQVVASRNRYRSNALDYLRKFSVIDGRPVFRPPPTARHLDSHVRNFLMEMGVVEHDATRDIYMIPQGHLEMYAMARDEAHKQTPSMLQAACREQEQLGVAAERAVVVHERQRVGEEFADRVAHVAVHNAGAGYDVRSVTLDACGAATPRYIEVKAVSSSSREFHWTRNEVRTAEALAEWYYLYLVPVKAGGRFAIDELEIIAKPLDAIFGGARKWHTEPDGHVCRLRPSQSSVSGISDEE